MGETRAPRAEVSHYGSRKATQPVRARTWLLKAVAAAHLTKRRQRVLKTQERVTLEPEAST